MPEKTENETQKLRNRDEAAAFIGVSTITLDRAVKNKKLSCVRIGRRVLFRPSDLETFINRNAVAAR